MGKREVGSLERREGRDVGRKEGGRERGEERKREGGNVGRREGGGKRERKTDSQRMAHTSSHVNIPSQSLYIPRSQPKRKTHP